MRAALPWTGWLLITVCIAFGAQPVRAQTTWHVDVQATPPGDGSPSNPFTSIQYAISRPTTVSGDTVLVAPGQYDELVDFLGKAIEVRATGGPATTTIANPNICEGSVVTFANNESGSSILAGFTVTGGRGTGPLGNRLGGGIYAPNSTPLIVECVIRNNITWHTLGPPCGPGDPCHPGGRGGGVYGNVVLVDCVVTENRAGTDGGIRGDCIAYRTEFSLNHCISGGAAASGNGYFEDCTFSNNSLCLECGSDSSCGGGAGGVLGAAHLVRCVVRGNFGSGGGVVGSPTSFATLEDCLIEENTAAVAFGGCGYHPDWGGGVSYGTLSRCTVRNNAVPQEGGGGGISTSIATHCVLVGNRAVRGSAAYGSQLMKCTVVANTATGMDCNPTATRAAVSSGTLTDCIVWNNAQLQVDGATAAYSTIQGGFPGTAISSLDPRFVAAADYHLRASSPCINAGDPASPPDADGSRADQGAFPFDPLHSDPLPSSYCVAKVSSQGCTPAIGSTGLPRLSITDDFFVTATLVRNNCPGMLFWGTAPDNVPFGGGVLCVASPLFRTAVQNSGGTPYPVPDCSGNYAFHFSHAYMSSQFVTPGTGVYAQWWQRDPPHPDGTGIGLTDALHFTVYP